MTNRIIVKTSVLFDQPSKCSLRRFTTHCGHPGEPFNSPHCCAGLSDFPLDRKAGLTAMQAKEAKARIDVEGSGTAVSEAGPRKLLLAS